MGMSAAVFKLGRAMPGIVRAGPGEFGSPEKASGSVCTCAPAAVGGGVNEGVRGRVVSHVVAPLLPHQRRCQVDETIGMFSFEDADPWSWRETDTSRISFPVWVLLQDGLRVSPFDRHPDAEGALRAAGLDDAGWRSWLDAMVALDVEAHDAVDAAHRLSPDDIAELRQAAMEPDRAIRTMRRRALQRATTAPGSAALHDTLRQLSDPVAAWPGDPGARAPLQLSFERWGKRDPGKPIFPRPPNTEEAERLDARRHALYMEYRAMSSRPRALSVHVVPYVAPVVEAVGPVTLVIGFPGEFVEDAYEDLLRRGLRLLGAHN